MSDCNSLGTAWESSEPRNLLEQSEIVLKIEWNSSKNRFNIYFAKVPCVVCCVCLRLSDLVITL